VLSRSPLGPGPSLTLYRLGTLQSRCTLSPTSRPFTPPHTSLNSRQPSTSPCLTFIDSPFLRYLTFALTSASRLSTYNATGLWPAFTAVSITCPPITSPTDYISRRSYPSSASFTMQHAHESLRQPSSWLSLTLPPALLRRCHPPGTSSAHTRVLFALSSPSFGVFPCPTLLPPSAPLPAAAMCTSCFTARISRASISFPLPNMCVMAFLFVLSETKMGLRP
jgi:hypothetical protein